MVLENLNPSVHEKLEERKVSVADFDNAVYDEIDEREVFDYIRHLQGIYNIIFSINDLCSFSSPKWRRDG